MPENAIVGQLKAIKIWVAICAIGFLLIGASVFIFALSAMQLADSFETESTQNECSDSSEFSRSSVSELFTSGKVDEAQSMSENRLVTHPNDSSALWMLARIHSFREEWDKALEYARKVERIEPSWREEYTKPMIDSIMEAKSNDS